MIKAVLWDFGGVILTSPFESFARYEREIGLPVGFIRSVNATNPLDNAWAKLERSDVDLDGFAALFETEARSLTDHPAVDGISGHRVIQLLAGDIRPRMVEALRRCKHAGLRVACLTNNITGPAAEGTSERQVRVAEVMALFDVVVESSKVGCRKPEVRFYEIACELVGVGPQACVFLDDLGINLKPAKAMGMRTVKVTDPDDALRELEGHTGLALLTD